MNKNTKRFLVSNFRKTRSDLSFDDLVASANNFFEDVNSAVSLGCYLRLKYSAYVEYLEMDVRPEDYVTADDFHMDYQCAKLLSKSQMFPRVFDTRKQAETSFIEAERKCRETNARFESERSPFIGAPVEAAILYGAQRKISRILGDAPSLTDIPLRFGPGSNVGLSKYTSVFDKLNATITLTSNLAKYASSIMSSVPCWSACAAGITAVPTPDLIGVKVPVKVVRGSKLGFVPKTAKTDRAICTEPLLNSIVQLGIGRVLRSRLNRAGCNLNTQIVNQKLARAGSITGELATIDLSAASDTISYQIVARLLPAPWLDLLSTCRCESFTYEGNTFPLEKFSSMGNGYTFELETLLFLSIARATCDHLGISSQRVNTYGDDIVIPSAAVETLRKVLAFCGFTVNEAKSFSSGPFRESCGKDWFLGHDVRPLFLKNYVTNESLMMWCNQIYRFSSSLEDRRWKRFYHSLKDLVPKSYHKLLGPDGYGDGHFISKPVPGFNTAHSYLRRGWDGRGYYTLTCQAIERRKDSLPAYSAALYGVQTSVSTTDTLNDVLTHQRKRAIKMSESHLSKDGLGVFNVRDFTRTVLSRAFHPWNE